MKPQIVTTDAGEELVILSRRDYDALLAQLGDEEAEDRMTERVAEEARRRIASGEDTLLRAGPDGRPPRPSPPHTFGERVRAARRAAGKSQMALAEEVRIGQSYLSEIENDEKMPSDEVVDRLAAVLGLTITKR
jgi:ribosome-binding protein aMBF1 (putative translation factor)